MKKKNENYLSNKSLLKEIHLSKSSFCSFTDIKYRDYDIIITDLDNMDSEMIERARLNRAERLSKDEYERRKNNGEKVKLSDCEIDIDTIKNDDIIIRLLTYSHIPLNLTRKKNKKTTADSREKVNFSPFQHWKFDECGDLICVGKSHWIGDLKHGEFSVRGGMMTNNLALMIIKLVERYASRYNFRNYTYNDEMRQDAIAHLCYSGLFFDEYRSDNPFCFYTQAAKNVFRRVLNIEKRNQNIRDDLMEHYGFDPSITRQLLDDYEQSGKKNNEF